MCEGQKPMPNKRKPLSSTLGADPASYNVLIHKLHVHRVAHTSLRGVYPGRILIHAGHHATPCYTMLPATHATFQNSYAPGRLVAKVTSRGVIHSAAIVFEHLGMAHFLSVLLAFNCNDARVGCTTFPRGLPALDNDPGLRQEVYLEKATAALTSRQGSLLECVLLPLLPD